MIDKPQTTEYQILTSFQSHDLENQVNEAIVDGWIPIGGMSMTSLQPEQAIVQNAFFYFSQAMVKHD